MTLPVVIHESFAIALIQNAGLLLAMVFALDFVTGRRELSSTRLRQVVVGVVLGLIGVTMIGVSVRFDSGIVFDTRSVLLAVSGFFLGVLPTSIAVAMTALYRSYIGGPAALTGILVIVSSGAIGVAWHHLRRRHRALEDVSWRELYALGVVVHLAMVALLLTLPRSAVRTALDTIAPPVMLIHPITTVGLGLLFVQRLRARRAAAALALSETRFRLLAENARDVIFRYEVRPEPRFTYVSPSCTTFTGYRPEDFYADPELGRKLVHPQDRPLLIASRDGEPADDRPLVLRWVRKDGAILWTEQRNSYVRDEQGNIVAVEGIVRDITGTKQADVMMRTALRATNLGIYEFNLQTGEGTVNEEYARMLGYDTAELRETYEEWHERVHPDDRERVAKALDDYLSGRTADYRAEYRQRTRTGEWLWFLALGSLVEWDGDGKPLRIVGTHTDITALKRAEQRMRDAQAETARLLHEADQSRRALLSLVEDQQAAERQRIAAEHELRRLAELLEASQAAARVGGWELDVSRRSLFWTDETYLIHDTTPEQYTPTLDSAIAFFTPESIPVLREVLREAIDDGTTRGVELELTTPAGRRKWVYFTTSVAMHDGRTDRVTCAIQDITARKEAERERLELTAQLHQAQKLESLGGLAGGVAHDMNNVLAAILSSAEAHRRAIPDGEPLARALDTIANACVRGRSVVRSLLYFARSGIESRGNVDLNEIVRDIVDLLDKTTLKRIHFTTRLEEPLPGVDGDHGALNHAVMNLCINAVDAMPNGGALTLTTRTVANGLVEVIVRDTGVGMTPEVQARVFEPFFTTKPVGKGTGLGLAMVYGTVKAHGGSLRLESEPGKGTEVTLAFPAKAPSAQARAIPAPAPPPPSTSMRVLLVDDDELIREGVALLLETFEHEVHTASGGREALRKLESGLTPDLIILDVNMPGMSGPETLDRILAIRPQQAVLMASGFGDEEMARAMAGRPNVASIQKPFTMDELEAKVSSLVLA